MNYSRDEEERLLADLRAGRPGVCPRCGHRMLERRVPPREGVPYVRDRVWLNCEGCHRSLVLDRRRIDETR